MHHAVTTFGDQMMLDKVSKDCHLIAGGYVRLREKELPGGLGYIAI